MRVDRKVSSQQEMLLPSRSNSDAKRREERGRRMIRLKNVCVAVGGENPNLG